MSRSEASKVVPLSKRQTRFPFKPVANKEYSEDKREIVGLLNKIKVGIDQIKSVFPNLSPAFVKAPAKKELDEHRSEIVCEDDTGLKARFQELVSTWKRETSLTTSVLEMAMHPAYQQIIGMGPIDVPLILNQLAAES